MRPRRTASPPKSAADFTRADWDDVEALARFAADCAVVTYEFENVAVGPAGRAGPGAGAARTRARWKPRRTGWREKRFVTELGGTPAPFAPVDCLADLAAAIGAIGAPGILKTRRDGYDGKGQWRIRSPRGRCGWTGRARR